MCVRRATGSHISSNHAHRPVPVRPDLGGVRVREGMDLDETWTRPSEQSVLARLSIRAPRHVADTRTRRVTVVRNFVGSARCLLLIGRGRRN